MTQDEEANCYVCFSVFDVSTGQSRASEVVWFASAVADASVKVGAHHYGLCGWFSEDTGMIRWSLSYCRSTDKDLPFPTIQDKVVSVQTCRVIYQRDSQTAWSSDLYCVR